MDCAVRAAFVTGVKLTPLRRNLREWLANGAEACPVCCLTRFKTTCHDFFRHLHIAIVVDILHIVRGLQGKL